MLPTEAVAFHSQTPLELFLAGLGATYCLWRALTDPPLPVLRLWAMTVTFWGVIIAGGVRGVLVSRGGVRGRGVYIAARAFSIALAVLIAVSMIRSWRKNVFVLDTRRASMFASKARVADP